MARRKAKKPLRVFIWISAIAAGLFIGYLCFLLLATPKPNFVRYQQFGIAMPTKYKVHGIDVSRYQRNIAWDMVKQMKVQDIQLDFVFIKATEGTNLVDPYFKRNWLRAKKAGMVRGAYHFFNPRKDGKKQADHFVKAVKIESGDLPPVLDIERAVGVNKEQLQKELRTWLQAMEAAYGVKPIIYTYVTFYDDYLKGKFDDYPLWIAHYYQQNNPRISRPWHFWQHSEEGRVNGIASKVDFNVFNGDSVMFKSLLVP